MFKYNSCIYETCNHYPCYPRIYFDDYPHFAYARRTLCCALVLSHYFFKGGGPMDSIMRHYELANFDDFSITGFLVPTSHYAQRIELILFKNHLKIKMKTVHHTPVEKIIEPFVSMIAGCPDIKTVNNRLVPDKLAAAAWC